MCASKEGVSGLLDADGIRSNLMPTFANTRIPS